jgi:DNA-binding CsgD family transcriptional regulator
MRHVQRQINESGSMDDDGATSPKRSGRTRCRAITRPEYVGPTDKCTPMAPNMWPDGICEAIRIVDDCILYFSQCIETHDVPATISLTERTSIRAKLLRIADLSIALERQLEETAAHSRVRVRRSLTELWTDKVSPREREVARLLVDGYTHVNIAARWGRSPNTVRKLIQRLYAKLGVTSRADLVRELILVS